MERPIQMTRGILPASGIEASWKPKINRGVTRARSPTHPPTDTRAQRETDDLASGGDSGERVIRYRVSRSVLYSNFKAPANFPHGRPGHGKSLRGHLIGGCIRCALQMLFAFQTNRSNDTTATFICLHKSWPRRARCSCWERLTISETLQGKLRPKYNGSPCRTKIAT